MFISVPSTILPILSIAAHAVFAVRQHDSITRRAVDCGTQCQPMQTSISAAQTGGIAVLCTQDVVSEYQACLGCKVAISDLTQPGAQAVIDSLVQSCQAGGHPVDGGTMAAITPTYAPAFDTSDSTAAASATSNDMSATPDDVTATSDDASAPATLLPTDPVSGSAPSSAGPTAGSGAPPVAAASWGGAAVTPNATGASGGSPAGSRGRPIVCRRSACKRRGTALRRGHSDNRRPRPLHPFRDPSVINVRHTCIISGVETLNSKYPSSLVPTKRKEAVG
ncbi:hypothetical protein B0H10DRAFT_2235999 [Mycena sp. CBHHK59/15]|nr:hypothetical protein B0H10DRAFT_2235999 [Mycena sp. CBHHK59/15]